jgi:hypothetical protein
MKRLFAFVCLMIPVMVACATEPAQPGTAAGTLAPELIDETGEAPIGAVADEQCLNYCTGGGKTPFLTCVPACRRDLKVVFSLEPVNLQLAPYCGDNICQLPEELTKSGEHFCRQDCLVRVQVSENRLIINDKIIADAEGENIVMRADAFDAGM